MNLRKPTAVALFCLCFPFAIVAGAVLAAIVVLVVLLWAFMQLITGFIAGAWAEAFGWDLHHSNGAWAYYVNPRTGARKAVYIAGHSPLEYRFLRPGDIVIDEVGSRTIQ